MPENESTQPQPGGAQTLFHLAGIIFVIYHCRPQRIAFDATVKFNLSFGELCTCRRVRRAVCAEDAIKSNNNNQRLRDCIAHQEITVPHQAMKII